MHYATLHLQLQLQLQLALQALGYTTRGLHCTRLPYSTVHNSTLTTTNDTTLITPHHNYNSTTLQLQLQLQYTTLHPAVVGEVTTETIATTPKTKLQHTPTTFKCISGFALPSVNHNNQPLV